MEKNGFFKIETRTLVFIGMVFLFVIVMFSPQVYNSTNSTGTAYPFIMINTILVCVPALGMIDGWFRGKAATRQETKKLSNHH